MFGWEMMAVRGGGGRRAVMVLVWAGMLNPWGEGTPSGSQAQ